MSTKNDITGDSIQSNWCGLSEYDFDEELD